MTSDSTNVGTTKNSTIPKRGDFFRHGFIDQNVQGYLCCKYQWPWTGWFEHMNELRMLHAIQTGLGHGFKLQEPPVRENVLVRNPCGPGELNGRALREQCRELFEEMMMLGVR